MTTDTPARAYPFEEFRGELPAELLRMVRDEPVSRVRLPDGRLAWLVLGYDEVTTVLSDPRFSRYGATPADSGAAGPASDTTGEAAETGSGCPVRALGMDGPAHTTLRRAAARAFTARRVQGYRPRVQRLTDDLLDAMAAGGQPGELISALVGPLPALVVCEVLGVPAADRDRFNGWADVLLSMRAYGAPETAAISAELRGYLAERVQAKRLEPGDDLLSAWLALTGPDRMSDEEIVGLAEAVLIGGREINSISVGLRALFAHPDAMARLRVRPDLLPAAVDEILRYTSVSGMFLVQTALAQVELAGTTIEPGDCVMAVPWAANRHPGAFERPDEFDIERSPNPHLTFGYGPHFCLGAAVGRLEVEVALGTLLRRFPDLAPAVPLAELPWRQERINCGIAAFPVTW